MNANEIANEGIVTQLAVVHTMLPKVKELIDNQIAEIEALKKSCLDEIFKRTYADRSAEVMCEYWQQAQANATRYEWLRAEFAAGRETYLAEDMPSGEALDKYIDGKIGK